MARISSEGRRVVARLLAGESLNDLAPPGDPLRAEVEAWMIGALESQGDGARTPPPKGRGRPKGGATTKGRASAPEDLDLPRDGRAVAWSDGASRGNPGPAAVGIRIVAGDGVELCAEGQAIGSATNNVAEYRGAIAALDKALELGLDRIELRMDSELVVKQVNGQYRVKDPTLARLKAELDGRVRRFASFRVRHVPRARNAATDRLANEALDRG
jgi:ribonuclease HI